MLTPIFQCQHNLPGILTPPTLPPLSRSLQSYPIQLHLKPFIPLSLLSENTTPNGSKMRSGRGMQKLPINSQLENCRLENSHEPLFSALLCINGRLETPHSSRVIGNATHIQRPFFPWASTSFHNLVTPSRCSIFGYLVWRNRLSSLSLLSGLALSLSILPPLVYCL
jgi:hypothetical protein